MKARTIRTDAANLGFQIAPMIDVVFVIMLFFMVMAGTMKAERHLISSLPSSQGDGFPDEVIVAISEDGWISLNDEGIADGSDVRLSELSKRLTWFLQDARARGGQPILVTVQAESGVRYQRIVDVLNVMGKVGYKNVTFTADSEE
jgi:biopolymer transport protein ExbD